MIQTENKIHGHRIPTSNSLRKVQLIQGQLFHGKILKLFPNHIASLTLQGIPLTAKLEAALSANKTYWFEVQSTKGMPILKVLDHLPSLQPTQGEKALLQSSSAILAQLGLQSTKGTQMLLEHFLKEQIPFSKESVAKGGMLLEQNKLVNLEGMKVIRQMSERNLPFTNDIFLAMKSLDSTPSLSVLLQQTLNKLVPLSSSEPNLQKLTVSLQTFLNDTTVEARNALVNLIQMLSSTKEEEQQGAFRLLQRIGLFSLDTTLEQQYSQFKAAVLDQKNKQIVQSLWPNLIQNEQVPTRVEMVDAKVLFDMLLTSANNTQKLATTQQFLSLFHTSTSITELQVALTSLSSYSSLTTSELTAYQRLLFDSVPTTGNNPSFANKLVELISRLGYEQESDLLRLLQGNSEVTKEMLKMETLKAQVMQAQQLDLSTDLKQRLEAIVLKITGQQLLTTEQHHPFQQLVIQLPLSFSGFQTDLTIQWEGQKKNGKFDPDHCRIIFYLQLERLKETIIDVQIQKKIVSIHVFNDIPRPSFLIENIQPFLQKQLDASGYQLALISWKNLKEPYRNPSVNKAYHYSSYQGVDVRI